MAYIDHLPFRLKYRCATLSFAADDISIDAFNRRDPMPRRQVSSAVELFVELAFAGVPAAARPPVLVSTHTHVGRLEVNILMPRAVDIGRRLRSFNPHPPTSGSRNDWDGFVDMVNRAFGWADPRCPKRRKVIAAPSWMEKHIAEFVRQRAAGEVVSLDLDDPRFRAYALARRAVRHGHVGRTSIVGRLNQGLAAHGWGVTSESRTGITCGPLAGSGRRVTLTGAAFRENHNVAKDSIVSEVRRQEELIAAPRRVREALAKRAAANRAIGGWPANPLPDPDRILASPRPQGAMMARLEQVIARVVLRVRLKVRAYLLSDIFTQRPLAAIRTTADKLETLVDLIRQFDRPATENRSTH